MLKATFWYSQKLFPFYHDSTNKRSRGGAVVSTRLPPMWPEFISNHGIDPKHGLISGLSKVASCQQKTLPTWLVWAGYYAWQFFTDGIFLNKIFLDWLLTLTTQPSASKLSDNPVSLLLVLPELFCYERFFSLYSGFPLSSKTNISKFQFIQNGRQKTHLCGCATSKLLQCIYLLIYLSIYLFIYLFITEKKGCTHKEINFYLFLKDKGWYKIINFTRQLCIN